MGEKKRNPQKTEGRELNPPKPGQRGGPISQAKEAPQKEGLKNPGKRVPTARGNPRVL